MIQLNEIANVQFGVAVRNVAGYRFVPVDTDVQITLVEILDNTQQKVNENSPSLREYEPSEKYGTREQLSISLDDEHLDYLRGLYNEVNIPLDSQPIENYVSSIEFYFAFFTLNSGARILAVRRPAVFKSLLKSRNYIIRWTDDTLKKVEDGIFKLDEDFDYYVYNNVVYINQPSGFQYTTRIEEFVQERAYEATINLATRVPLIRFTVMADFIRESKTGAKLIASIKKRDDLNQINKKNLMRLCNRLRIQLEENDDESIHPSFEDKYIDFLMVLDRRLFEYSLIKAQKELYEAHSRIPKH